MQGKATLAWYQPNIFFMELGQRLFTDIGTI